MSQAGIISTTHAVPGLVETLTGNVGGAVGPDGANNIFILGAGDILVTGIPGLNTLEISYSPPATQVFFSAFRSILDANATGDGTVATVVFDTVAFNVGAAYNIATGIFTAPSNGLYSFCSTIMVSDLDPLHDVFEMAMVGTAEDVGGNVSNPGVAFSIPHGNSFAQNMSTIIQMNAADTLEVRVVVDGATKTVDIFGQALPGYITWFRGYRIA